MFNPVNNYGVTSNTNMNIKPQLINKQNKNNGSISFPLPQPMHQNSSRHITSINALPPPNIPKPHHQVPQVIKCNIMNNINTEKGRKHKKISYSFKGEIFKIWDYYVPIKVLGTGAYAVVIEAKDTRFNKKHVAIKKNKNVFSDISDAKRILREIKILQTLQHDDIINLIDVIPPDETDRDTFNDVYLVMPKMETTLKRIIKSDQKLENRHYLFFIHQILRGLKYIHSSGVVHRDLKPENILVNGKNCNVKISDFGLARSVSDRDKSNLTEYVVTRWYRAPEVMICAKNYNEQVDVWSVGCIFAELLLRRELFPGNNHFEQLSLMFSILGSPDNLDWISSKDAKEWIEKLEYHRGHDLRKIFKNAKPAALDVIRQMLQINPWHRIKVNQALSHPYFARLHRPKSEKCINHLIDSEIEGKYNSMFGIKHLMYQTLVDFHQKKNTKIKPSGKHSKYQQYHKKRNDQKQIKAKAAISIQKQEKMRLEERKQSVTPSTSSSISSTLSSLPSLPSLPNDIDTNTSNSNLSAITEEDEKEIRYNNSKNKKQKESRYGPIPLFRAETHIQITQKITKQIVPESIRERLPNLWHYINNSILNENKKQFKNGDIVIINYDFHDIKSGDILYCILEKQQYVSSNRRYYEYKMIERLFKSIDIYNEYGISPNRLPKSVRNRKKYLSQINDKENIINILNEYKNRNELFNKTNWCRIPVFMRRDNNERMTLKLVKRKFISYCTEFGNKNDNIDLIPILMFDDNNNNIWMEHLWIVSIKGNDIGIALIFDSLNDRAKVMGIHLDREYIHNQHQLVSPQHMNKCKCLDNFKSFITEICIGNVEELKNKIKDLRGKYEIEKEKHQNLV